MFWFLLIAMVVVVAAVTLVVLGGDDGGGLRDAEPDRLYDPLPDDRPVVRADVDAVRIPLSVRGYRMSEVDDVLDRLGAELTERDARIAELEAALAGAHAAAMGGPGPAREHRPGLGTAAIPRTPEAPEAPGTPEDPAAPKNPKAPEAPGTPEGEERA
ncbi:MULTISPECIES: DivIVA domain-containing protein [Streptomyces]|uniref:DivIVA domain-containing protein n=1 Tax=Streptomyces kasugaensis TaxID=1946 RepID=A0A4Q9HRH4_STRKA|nr:DivIVA domain-containing protein [Streptomyces kasugaensis]TBO57119.1 DivIVA domain-containing protein [Streptomyces kasugaensis]